MKRNILILIICCLAVTIRYFYPPTKSSAQNGKWMLYPKKKASDTINDKEQKKGALLNDTAQRSMDNVFAQLEKRMDKQEAYITLLEKTNTDNEAKIKWFNDYVKKLKQENSSLLMLKKKREAGDTLEAKFAIEERSDFITQIADSIKASLPPPDTLLKEKYGPFYNRKIRYVKKPNS